MNYKQIIDIFKKTNALLDGHFILTSGRHSSTYFQCAKVLQYPEYLAAFSILIANQFKKLKPDVIIAPAIGGIVLGTEVGAQLGCRTIFSERNEGKMVIRRGFKINPNDNVLIIEDVITTGGSVKEVMDLVTNSSGNIIGVGVLVDRSNGKANLHPNQFSIIELEAISYKDSEIPEDLALIPIQKPGSRYLK